jgi:hypothetical protein
MPDERVRIKNNESMFNGRTGTVISMTATGWDYWVKLDTEFMGNYTFGFMEFELEEIPYDSTGSAG